MQLLNAVAIMAIAFSIPAMTAEPDDCVPSTTISSNSNIIFQLEILIPDDDGKTDVGVSRFLKLRPFNLSSSLSVNVPSVGQPDARVFFLRDKKLSTDENNGDTVEATFLGADDEISTVGWRSFVWASTSDDASANFTITGDCDSFGNSFFRLGGNEGKLMTPKLLFTLLIRWSVSPDAHWTGYLSGKNSFIIDSASPHPQVFYRPDSIVNYARKFSFISKINEDNLSTCFLNETLTNVFFSGI